MSPGGGVLAALVEGGCKAEFDDKVSLCLGQVHTDDHGMRLVKSLRAGVVHSVRLRYMACRILACFSKSAATSKARRAWALPVGSRCAHFRHSWQHVSARADRAWKSSAGFGGGVGVGIS